MKLRMRGPLDRLAALDPTGVVGQRVVGVARRVPGVAVGERVVQRLEDAVLRELNRRLEEATGTRRELPAAAAGAVTRAGEPLRPRGPAVDPPRPRGPAVDPPRPPAASRNGHAGARLSPAELMDSLLRRSVDQDPAAGERSLVVMLIGELVPDEARILAALSDGSPFPVLDVVARGGEPHRAILTNVSSIGRQAGVVLPDRVPVYLGHLTTLGLIQREPEDPGLSDEYETLQSDPAVIRARDAPLRRRPRVVRAVVRISELGQTVWQATRG